MFKAIYILSPANLLLNSPACLTRIYKVVATLASFMFHEANKHNGDSAWDEQQGGRVKTSSWHHQDPGSNLSWSPIYHWTLWSHLIPFPFSFLSFHQPLSHPAFFGKSGSSSIKNYVPLLTISQKLSEKCYSQRQSLQRIWFYSRVQQKLKKSYSWYILGEFAFTNIQEQLNMTFLKFNVAVVFSFSLQYLLIGDTRFSISPSLYICF